MDTPEPTYLKLNPPASDEVIAALCTEILRVLKDILTAQGEANDLLVDIFEGLPAGAKAKAHD